jgi:hypothetical protein
VILLIYNSANDKSSVLFISIDKFCELFILIERMKVDAKKGTKSAGANVYRDEKGHVRGEDMSAMWEKICRPVK